MRGTAPQDRTRVSSVPRSPTPLKSAATSAIGVCPLAARTEREEAGRANIRPFSDTTETSFAAHFGARECLDASTPTKVRLPGVRVNILAGGIVKTPKKPWLLTIVCALLTFACASK